MSMALLLAKSFIRRELKRSSAYEYELEYPDATLIVVKSTEADDNPDEVFGIIVTRSLKIIPHPVPSEACEWLRLSQRIDYEKKRKR